MFDMYSYLLGGGNGGSRPPYPETWDEFQAFIRSGLIKKVYETGDQVFCKRGENLLVWDILDFDKDKPIDPRYHHSVTLGLHDCWASLQFSARQAFYVASEVLPIGTYNFYVNSHPWSDESVGKYFQFTTTKEIPVGGQLLFMQAYNATLEGASVNIYLSNTSTGNPNEVVTLTEGNGGTNLGTIYNAITEDFNSIQRALLGSNNWKDSAIRQLLNSSAAAGSVWTPQTKWDRKPEWNSTEKGWMNGIDADFLAVIGDVTKITAKTVMDGGGYDTTIDKFFLLSKEETYGGRENDIDEGGAYKYYSEFSDLPTAGGGEDTNRIKYLNGTAGWWWLRTPNAGNGYSVRIVNPTGAMTNYGATNSNGFAPACVIW